MHVNIKNYQTIKDLSLKIEGFTVIVGKSNTGKTAILRALEGSMFNDPVKGKVRTGEPLTEVDVQYRDLNWVWTKGATQNAYKVTTPEGTQEYSSVGRNVPDKIKSAGFREWWVDKEKTRLQVVPWHQPIFLLNKTGKVITELMTAVTRLDVVNLAIRNCASEMRKNKQTLKLREKDLQRAEKRVRVFDTISNIPEIAIQEGWEVYQRLKKDIQEVRQFDETYEALGGRIENLSPSVDVKAPSRMNMDLPNTLERLQRWELKMESAQRSLKDLSVIEEVTLPDRIETPQDLVRIERWLKDLSGVDSRLVRLHKVDEVSVPSCNLMEGWELVDTLESYYTSLVTILKSIRDIDLKKVETEEQLKNDLEELTELRGQVVECPVCGAEGGKHVL